MPASFARYFKFIVATGLVISFCLVEGEAQTRRKRRTRRATTPAPARPVITNPPVAPPAATTPAEPVASDDVKIISTADGAAQEPTEATQPKKTNTATQPAGEQEMQQTITTLSNQVNKLNDRLEKMHEDDRYQLEMERLTRAEQRAEQVRSQLIDTQAKIADFESRIEQVEFALRPENIESSTAGYGSTRPEQTREARRKQLESERNRLIAQLKLVQTSKIRLETAVANADAEVDLLRAKLEMRRQQMDTVPAVSEPAPAKPRKP
jgi:small-conductance mechanosensitive channel